MQKYRSEHFESYADLATFTLILYPYFLSFDFYYYDKDKAIIR